MNEEKPKLFDTDEKKAQAVSAFLSLLQHPGWLLLEQILDENILHFREQLENGSGEGETKADVDLLRFQLNFCKEHKNKPKDLIEKLSTQESKEPNLDPYFTVESLKKQRDGIA